MTDNLPLVSVIITTKNEAKNIENCIKSIKAQTYPADKIEIIVVDNFSEDGTRELAQKYTKLIFDLKKEIDLSEIKNYRGAQLNFGVSQAKGEIIFFPDADMTFAQKLLEEAVEKLKTFGALYTPEFVCGQGFFGKIRNFERSFYNQTCIDGVRIVKKEVFLKVGGFDIKNIVFGPDDWDFTKTLGKNGIKIGITSNFLFHHEETLNLKTYLNKKAKYIKTFSGYIAKWGKNDLDVKKQFGLRYRYFGVFLENGKWKNLIFHPLLGLGMYFLRILVGMKFVPILCGRQETDNYVKTNIKDNTADKFFLNGEKPLVSVILPIKKYKNELPTVIDSVFNQSYINLEFILVTPELSSDIESLKNKYNFTIEICEGKSKSRNHGSNIANGDYLFHIDDDMILAPDIVEECINLVDKKGARAIVIFEEERKGKGIINKTRMLEKRIVSYDKIIESPRFIEKKLFKDIGGFNELLDPMDDGDLKAKLEEKEINIYYIKSKIEIIAGNRTSILPLRFWHMFERGKKAPLFNAIHQRSKQLRPFSRLKPYFAHKRYLLENLGVSALLFDLKFLDLIFFKFGTWFVTEKDKKIIAEIKNKKLYENTAGTYQQEFYEATLGAKYVDKKEKETISWYLKKYDKNMSLKILDIGAGGGRWSKLLLDKFPNARVTACDLSQEMTKNLFTNLGYCKNRFEAVNADMQRLPFENEEFDLALSIRAIKYAQDQTKVFKEINRVLKPGGIAIIELPNYNFVYKIIKHIKIFGILSDYANRIVLNGKKAIEKNLQENNFKIISSKICFSVPSTLYKKVNSRVILIIINMFNCLLPKKIFGRSLFYSLVKK